MDLKTVHESYVKFCERIGTTPQTFDEWLETSSSPKAVTGVPVEVSLRMEGGKRSTHRGSTCTPRHV